MATTPCRPTTRETYSLTATGETHRRCTPLSRYRISRDPEGQDLLAEDFRDLRMPSMLADQAAANASEGRDPKVYRTKGLYVWDTKAGKLAYTGDPAKNWRKQLEKLQRNQAMTERRIAELERLLATASR